MGPLMTLTPDMVKSEVERYWTAFRGKNAASLSEFYAQESVGFSTTSKRSEPGRMVAVRRAREYFETEGTVNARIDSIDVVMLGESAAITSYTFQFFAQRRTALGKLIDEEVRHGRSTQVFGIDTDGRPRVFHEHFSQAAE